MLNTTNHKTCMYTSFVISRNPEILMQRLGWILYVNYMYPFQIQLSNIVMEDDAVYRCELLSDSTEFVQETFVFCSKLIYR